MCHILKDPHDSEDLLECECKWECEKSWPQEAEVTSLNWVCNEEDSITSVMKVVGDEMPLWDQNHFGYNLWIFLYLKIDTKTGDLPIHSPLLEPSPDLNLILLIWPTTHPGSTVMCKGHISSGSLNNVLKNTWEEMNEEVTGSSCSAAVEHVHL